MAQKKLYKHGWCQVLQQPRACACHYISQTAPQTRIHLCNGWSLLFRRECMFVKGWDWGSSANMKYFLFPSLHCCPHTEALSSAHSACVTELAALQQPCPHTLHTRGKWLIIPPGTPCEKAVEFPLFENDICTYSNSWLIKKVSVDRCQNT